MRLGLCCLVVPFAMSRIVRNIGFISNQLNYLSLQSVRFYPRWTHRTPSRIIESGPKREPKASWRVEAEKEIVRSSTLSKASPLVEFNTINDSKKEKIVVQDPEDCVRGEDLAKVGEVAKGSGFIGDEYNVKGGSNLGREGKYGKFSDKPYADKNHSPETSDKTKIPAFPRGKKEIAVEAEYLKRMESAIKLGVPLFEKLGNDDTKLSQYVLDSKSANVRKKSKLILLEGKRLIEDALQSGVIFEAIFFTRVKDIQYLSLPEKGLKLYKMTYNSMSSWSDTTTCPGIIGFAKIPDVEKMRPASLPLTVICDNVRDPGNLGAVLRTSAAVGCECVLLIKGCVDLWNPKVIRAAAGAHFRLRIYKDVEWDDVEESIDKDANVFIADNDSYEVTICEDEGKETSDGNDADDASLRPSRTYASVETDNVPLIPYYGFNFTNACSLVLIVGGETEGISEEAYNFMYEKHGLRLNIPLSNNVESLNTGTALGIIAFEMKKQFLMKLAGDSVKLENEKDNIAAFRTL